MTNEDAIVKNILQLGAFMYREGNRMIENYSLNQQQFIILKEIVTRQKVSQKQLVTELLLEKSNVSKIVKKLKSAKLINIKISQEDKRTTFLSPSKKGREVSNGCMGILHDWNMKWLASYPERKKIEVLSVLQSLNSLPKNTPGGNKK